MKATSCSALLMWIHIVFYAIVVSLAVVYIVSFHRCFRRYLQPFWRIVRDLHESTSESIVAYILNDS